MVDEIRTLNRLDYISDEIFALEQERIFHAGWFLAGRGDVLRPGNRTAIDVAGESVLLTRDRDGRLHALANVCRHRGSQLCDGFSASEQGTIMCPYHAWTYALDGQLIATPHLDDSELDKSQYPLTTHHVAEWQGFVFVSVAATPPPFEQWLADEASELTRLARFPFDELVVAATSVCDVDANWKIVVENYQECLHCTRVHPELVDLVPTYRSGWVTDHSRDDGGVALSRGHSFASVDVDLPVLPGLSDVDASSYFGGTIFPNGFVDATGTCVILSTLSPKGPNLTTMTMEYMFAPGTVATPGFDPTPIVEFNDLVAAQDNMVCARVQRGVKSKAFEHGVLTPKDEYVVHFVRRYLAARGPLT